MSYATHDLITKIHFFSSSKNRQGSIANLEVHQQQLAMAAPDLSLHISPPSPPDARSSGGGGGHQANHETGVFFSKQTLCLGLVETKMATAQQDGQCDIQQQQQRLHQPSQIQRFKKGSSAALSEGTTRSGNGGSGGGKRSSRAPRMRWTTALHAHFVHAVELLGGHESTFFSRMFLVHCLLPYFHHPCSVKFLVNY